MSLRLLEIGKWALLTHRSALEVVGHNTANVETPGYVRQRPLLAAIPGAVTGEAGGGVVMQGLERLRDDLLYAQLTYERGWLGRESALRASLAQVEHIFADVSEGGLASGLEEMFDAWGSLGLEPTSPACRELVVQRAELAAGAISGRWHQLHDLRVETDQRLAGMVARANEIAGEIARINVKIGGSPEGSGRNDLMSKRDLLLSELAELCGAEGIEQENGVVDVLIGGRRMVELGQVAELELVDDPAQPGFHLVALGGAVSPDGLRGEISGRLQARDEFIPQYMASLDTLAQTLADEVNALHSAGLDLAGNPGGDFFEYDASGPAASLVVVQAIADDPSLVAASENAGPPGDGANASAIENLRNSRVLGGNMYTLSEFTGEVGSQVGIDAQTAQTRLDGRQMLVDNLYGDYIAQSGVSLDEEALELIRYQQAYLAASRVISVALAVMDDVLALQ